MILDQVTAPSLQPYEIPEPTLCLLPHQVNVSMVLVSMTRIYQQHQAAFNKGLLNAKYCL